ncbi:MAG: peptidylprolyl isomerase, partial [Sulfurimicrobium sp.]|nr:peptidylprolyl isomerase [Sulfurimicrobium sp.]
MNSIRKQLLSIYFGVSLLGASTLSLAAETAPARVATLDRIVAVVNSDVITQLELDERLRMVTQQLQKQGTPLPPREILEKQLLERVIMDRVQLQFAQETGVKVDDVQLERTLQRIAQENQLSLEQFRAALEKDGIDFKKFREDIRKEVTMARLREREVDNRITVSDGEVENYLNSRSEAQGGGNEFNLAHVLIRVPEQASPEQLQKYKAKALQAQEELRAGKDFRQVAASYSDAADALQGGVLGWRPAGQLPTLFVEALEAMNTGEASPVLRSPNGFHILILLDKRGKDVPFVVRQTRARHILIKVNEIMSEQDAKNRALQIKERLDNGADFAELARLHSEDGSASRGGELNWLSPGDTVPEFEKAMDALKPGALSEPVRSPFGWHLIQVQERREEDVSKERKRLQARQEIRARKADEAYQEWLRQLRDRAYVEYRLAE